MGREEVAVIGAGAPVLNDEFGATGSDIASLSKEFRQLEIPATTAPLSNQSSEVFAGHSAE
jgi:hypothetical protein